MKKYLVIQFFLFFFLSLTAQIPLGAWRDHLPYGKCKKVAKAGSTVYCATDNNIFTYNVIDNSVQKLSKINGLSDIGVSTIEFCSEKNTLLIAYDDGNIDLLKDFKISNIPDIRNRVMAGLKSANNIFFRGLRDCNNGINVS